MSNIQAPMCAHHPRTRKDVAFSWPELPLAHPDAIPLHGVFLEGENTFMRRKAEQIVQCKLQTYQAAAVVVRAASVPFIPWVLTRDTFFLETVHCSCRSGIATSSVLQNITQLSTATSAAHAILSLRSHLRRSDLQRELHNQLPRSHESFRECYHTR
jgi:hypothetical protein